MITRQQYEQLKALERKRDSLKGIIDDFDSKFVPKSFGFNRITTGVVNTYLSDSGHLRSVRTDVEATKFLHHHYSEIVGEMNRYALKVLNEELEKIENEISKILIQ